MTAPLPMFRRSPVVAASGLLLAAGLLVGCEKTTTTVETPSGTTTTTTISPTPAASSAIGEAGDALANGALTTKVKAALLADPDVKSLPIEVTSRDGVVTLAGSLDTPTGIERAVAVTQGVEGVKSVESRLTAKPAS